MKLLFIGGGNMASALIGGLVGNIARSGTIAARDITVIEPHTEQRLKLQSELRVNAVAQVDYRADNPFDAIVWAVKPQQFAEAAATHSPAKNISPGTLHLSVMAGVRVSAIAQATQAAYVVRTMPNTPALIGLGITGAYASNAVSAAQRSLVESIVKPSGELVWVREEAQLDAVTALSGSGPAYVFYFVEAMMQAAREMGLDEAQGKLLALATFTGAAELARRSSDSPATLRERVTSKGGTTFAALSVLDAHKVKAAFVEALHAAKQRSKELGDELQSAAK
jgi:pyrroline-5-carboxylate reductase